MVFPYPIYAYGPYLYTARQRESHRGISFLLVPLVRPFPSRFRQLRPVLQYHPILLRRLLWLFVYVCGAAGFSLPPRPSAFARSRPVPHLCVFLPYTRDCLFPSPLWEPSVVPPRPARPPGSFPGMRFAGKLIDGHRRRTRLSPHHRPPGSPPLVCGGTGDVVGVSLPLPFCPPRPPTGCPGRLRPAFARGCAVPRFRRMRGLRHRCLVHRKALLFSPPVPTAGRHS